MDASCRSLVVALKAQTNRALQTGSFVEAALGHLCHQYHLSVMEEGLELLSNGATCWGPSIISFCMANWR